MRIAVVTPIWKRRNVTAVCLRYRFAWDVQGIDFEHVIVASPDDDERIDTLTLATRGTDTSLYYREADNQPLGAKFNAGVEYARELSPDYVMIMGSDALVHDSIFADYPWGASFMGVFDTYLYDVATAKAYYWPGYPKPTPGKSDRRGQVIGPGRLYAARLLDSIGWRPYPDDFSINLDGEADARLPKPAGIWARDHKMCSIKTEDSITTTRQYKNAREVSTAELYFKGADFTQL